MKMPSKRTLFPVVTIMAVILTLSSIQAADQSGPYPGQRPVVSQPGAITRQSPTVSQPSGISAADKAAIVKLFEGVDPNKYQLRFNGGREVYGRKRVAMNDLTQVSRSKSPGDRGWIVFVVEGDDVVYVLAVGSSEDLTSTLGNQKAGQLKSILSKYNR